MTYDYDWSAEDITPEVEEAMAWVEDEMNAMEPEEEVGDEIRVGMDFDTVVSEIATLYPDGIPAAISSTLLKRMLSRPAYRGFAYTTIYVPSVINATLAEQEPAWFNARRPMPDLDDQVMRLVIGRRGCGLKRFTADDGALFIWYDKETYTIRIWGFAPSTKLGSVMDVDFNLRAAIEYQTKRRHAVALQRLHRATEKRRGQELPYLTRPRSPSSESESSAPSKTHTYSPSDFPALPPLPTFEG